MFERNPAMTQQQRNLVPKLKRLTLTPNFFYLIRTNDMVKFRQGTSLTLDSLRCCSFSHQYTSITHVYYHNWGASVKPDNLRNQRGVQIAASFGSLAILYFLTTHFRVGTLREPVLYRGVTINAGTGRGFRQWLDDTYNLVGFIRIM